MIWIELCEFHSGRGTFPVNKITHEYINNITAGGHHNTSVEYRESDRRLELWNGRVVLFT